MPGIRHCITFGSVVVTALVAALWFPVQADDETVSLENIAFVPDSVTINVGDTVTWVHNDDPAIPHNVISTDGGPLSSPLLNQGQTYEFTFDTPGTYNYQCTVHPTVMTGVVIVEAEEPTPTPTPTEPADTPTPTPTQPADTPTPTPAIDDTPTPVPATPTASTPVETPDPTPTRTTEPATTPAPPAVGLGTRDDGGAGWLMPLVAFAVVAAAASAVAVHAARRRFR